MSARLDIRLQRRIDDAGRPFLLDVAFATDAERVALVGPSGAGKSLTLRAIAGLLRPDAGHVRLAGDVLFDAARSIHLAPEQRGVGLVFQDYALFPHLTVAQNVAFGLQRGWRNATRGNVSDEVRLWLRDFGLEELAGHYPVQVSGGQQQRVALARALAPRPRLLLLDEPFAALDQALRERLRNDVLALQRRLGFGLIVVTHDARDAERMGEEILELREGRIVTSAGRAAPVEA